MDFRTPVTSIEKYHLFDDGPSNPNVLGANITVFGKIDFDAAYLAADETLRRHPLVCARLERGRWGRWYWVTDEKSIRQFKFETTDDEMQFASPRIVDPWHSSALRVIVREEGDRSYLSFRLHHAAVDGLGCWQCMVDWMMAYHRIMTRSGKPKARQLDLQQLSYRNHLRLLSRKFLLKLWIQPIAVLGVTKFLLRQVETIAKPPHEQSSVAAPEDYQLISRSLDAERLRLLNSDARAAKATINEFIVRAVFLGLHRFRQETGRHQAGQWLRLMIPINIRDYADRRLPAANRASIVQLDRTDRDFDDPDGLIWSFNYELGNIRKWNLEKTFLLIIRCMSLIPGLLERSARKNVCRATSVLTNLGAPLDRVKLPRQDEKIVAGNLIIEDIDLIVPLRPLTPVGFAAMKYAGIQRLTMHYDPLQITDDEAEHLMNLVDDELSRGYKSK